MPSPVKMPKPPATTDPVWMRQLKKWSRDVTRALDKLRVVGDGISTRTEQTVAGTAVVAIDRRPQVFRGEIVDASDEMRIGPRREDTAYPAKDALYIYGAATTGEWTAALASTTDLATLNAAGTYYVILGYVTFANGHITNWEPVTTENPTIYKVGHTANGFTVIDKAGKSEEIVITADCWLYYRVATSTTTTSTASTTSTSTTTSTATTTTGTTTATTTATTTGITGEAGKWYCTIRKYYADGGWCSGAETRTPTIQGPYLYGSSSLNDWTLGCFGGAYLFGGYLDYSEYLWTGPFDTNPGTCAEYSTTTTTTDTTTTDTTTTGTTTSTTTGMFGEAGKWYCIQRTTYDDAFCAGAVTATDILGPYLYGSAQLNDGTLGCTSLIGIGQYDILWFGPFTNNPVTCQASSTTTSTTTTGFSFEAGKYYVINEKWYYGSGCDPGNQYDDTDFCRLYPDDFGRYGDNVTFGSCYTPSGSDPDLIGADLILTIVSGPHTGSC